MEEWKSMNRQGSKMHAYSKEDFGEKYKCEDSKKKKSSPLMFSTYE